MTNEQVKFYQEQIRRFYLQFQALRSMHDSTLAELSDDFTNPITSREAYHLDAIMSQLHESLWRLNQGMKIRAEAIEELAEVV